MRWFIAFLLLVGLGYWWQHHTPATEAIAKPAAIVSAATPAPAAAVVQAPVAPAPAGQASWPRRNIDRAQAAVNAAKATREGL